MVRKKLLALLLSPFLSSFAAEHTCIYQKARGPEHEILKRFFVKGGVAAKRHTEKNAQIDHTSTKEVLLDNSSSEDPEVTNLQLRLMSLNPNSSEAKKLFLRVQSYYEGFLKYLPQYTDGWASGLSDEQRPNFSMLELVKIWLDAPNYQEGMTKILQRTQEIHRELDKDVGLVQEREQAPREVSEHPIYKLALKAAESYVDGVLEEVVQCDPDKLFEVLQVALLSSMDFVDEARNACLMPYAQPKERYEKAFKLWMDAFNTGLSRYPFTGKLKDASIPPHIAQLIEAAIKGIASSSSMMLRQL